MSKPEIEDFVIEIAERSPCNKRKVGAVITDVDGTVLAYGHNYNLKIPGGGDCEDSNGETKVEVQHAEITAIKSYLAKNPDKGKFTRMYVTHTPCKNCLEKIAAAGINDIKVVEKFMKFDGSKLRYDLIPPSSLKALAEVLTYGARKYKPNNWKKVEEYDRYIAALMRHFEAWRSGEIHDDESGMPHLWHVLTNAAFLVELTGETKATDGDMK